MSPVARLDTALVAACVVLMPWVASAQQVATSFDQLQGLVKSGDTIFVTTTNGRTTKGRLGDLSASSLELLVRKMADDGREMFVPGARLSEPEVNQIRLQRRDSLLNGALIGLAIGGGPWLYAQIASGGYGEPGAEDLFLWVALFAGGTGAGIGTAIDALMTQKAMVYYHVPAQRAGRVSVSPVISTSATALTMSLRW